MVKDSRDSDRIARIIEFVIGKFKDALELIRYSIRWAYILKIVAMNWGCEPIKAATIPGLWRDHSVDAL